MPVHIIWEKADGSVIKGLQDCAVPSPTTKEIVDSDLNHGVVRPGETTVPQVSHIRTFSWSNNGDATNPITDVGLFLTTYYTAPPTFLPDASFTFCGSASSATFGDYDDANGSHSAASDVSNLQTFGDDATGGVEVSVDLGRTYTAFSSAVGTFNSPIELASTAMDIGTTNGQLNSGDRATIYTRITVPSTFTSAADAGVYLFNIGLFYSYSE